MSSSWPYDAVNHIITTLADGDISRGKSALLTLHFLFPHELLPALDLLDRQLVTQLIFSDEQDNTQHNEVYYVQSASALSSRPTKTSRHHIATAAAYEVRLASWNCSCPAFAYSAFGKSYQTALSLDESSIGSSSQQVQIEPYGKPRLGGVLTQAGAGVPICKHILATLLGAVAPEQFGNGICTKEVDKAEAAGWAGGWGD